MPLPARKKTIAAQQANDPRKDLALENLQLREQLDGLRRANRDHERQQNSRQMLINKLRTNEARALNKAAHLEEQLLGGDSRFKRVLANADARHEEDKAYARKLNKAINLQQQLIWALIDAVEYNTRTIEGSKMRYNDDTYKRKAAELDTLLEELQSY